MLTTQGFIARDLYNKGVLPTKYLNLIGIPEVEFKWVNYSTGATKKSGWVESGSLYLLYKFVNGVRSDETLVPWTSNWQFVSSVTPHDATLVSLETPQVKAQANLTWGAGIWNIGKSYQFFAQGQDAKNNGWYGPDFSYYCKKFSTATKMSYTASTSRVAYSGRPESNTSDSLNDSSYSYKSSNSRPFAYNRSTNEQCVSLDNIALKVAGTIIWQGSNATI